MSFEESSREVEDAGAEIDTDSHVQRIDNYNDYELESFLTNFCFAKPDEVQVIIHFRNEVRGLLNDLLNNVDAHTDQPFIPDILIDTMLVKLGKRDPRKPGDEHWFQG